MQMPPCLRYCSLRYVTRSPAWHLRLRAGRALNPFFPLQYVIMAMHARPVPQDPFNPLLSSDKNDTVRYPSPFIPIRLPIFAAVIWLNDLIVRILSVGGSVGEPRHNRAPSNSSERAEEGTGIDLHRIPPGTRKPRQQGHNPGRPVERTAVQSSHRRKRD